MTIAGERVNMIYRAARCAWGVSVSRTRDKVITQIRGVQRTITQTPGPWYIRNASSVRLDRTKRKFTPHKRCRLGIFPITSHQLEIFWHKSKCVDLPRQRTDLQLRAVRLGRLGLHHR